MKIQQTSAINFGARIKTRDFMGLLCDMPTTEKPGELYKRALKTLTNGKVEGKRISTNKLFTNIYKMREVTEHKHPELYKASRELNSYAEDAAIKTLSIKKYFKKINKKLDEIENKFGVELDIKDFE